VLYDWRSPRRRRHGHTSPAIRINISYTDRKPDFGSLGLVEKSNAGVACFTLRGFEGFFGCCANGSWLHITIIIAAIGFKSFDRWHREQIETRRIEVAIKVLALVYKAKFVFENIRSEMSFGYEWDDMPEFPGDTPDQRRQRGQFFAVLKRISNNKEFFEKTWELQAESTAVFGPRAEEAFLLMHRARRQIEVSAGMLMRDPHPTNATEENKKLWDRLQCDVWPAWGQVAGRTDEVAIKLGDFRKRMEDLCRPIIDRDFAKDPRLSYFRRRVTKSEEALKKGK
jgi:hypothetical protein